MNSRRALAIVAAAGLWLPGYAAWAQSTLPLRSTFDDPADQSTIIPDPNLIVVEQSPPKRRKVAGDPYAPRGISLGAITLYPSLGVGGVATSNVQGSAKDAKADTGLALRPAIRLESDWVRHQWTAGASGDLSYYADNPDLNGRNLDIFQRFRLDVRRGTTAVLEESYVQGQAGLEESDVPASVVGYRTEHTLASSAAVTQDLGGFEARIKAGGVWRIFEDVALSGGGTEDNSDRDYVEPALTFRATFTDPPVIKPFVEAGYAPRIHQRKFDRNGLRRDSNGYSVGAGVTLDRGPIWSGDVALTYLRRDYEDPALKSNDAFGLNGNLTWSPTEVTRIVLSLGTSLSETSSATSSGSRNWSIGLAASQAVRENVDVSAGLGANIETADTGTDVTYDASLGVAWKLNPNLSWSAGYDFTWLNAANSDRDYTVHKISTGLTISR